jgi:chemotaxis protein MotB
MAIEEDQEPGIPEWVVTFGDMMSLLLTFFIMLVSMSEIKEEERFQAMVESMRQQFGHEASLSSLVPGDNRPRNSNMQHVASQGRAKRKDTLRGGDKTKAPVGENTKVQAIRPGQNATASGVVYFTGIETELTEENKQTLQQITEQVAGKPQVIEVRGHTMAGPLPEENGIRDHWDLAYERCRNVREFLVAQGVDQRRIRMTPAGKNEPIYVGVDSMEQKRNSRVQVMMWDERVPEY